jgi:hypothetical protein
MGVKVVESSAILLSPTSVDVVYWNVGSSFVPITECVCMIKVKYIIQRSGRGSNFRASWGYN